MLDETKLLIGQLELDPAVRQAVTRQIAAERKHAQGVVCKSLSAELRSVMRAGAAQYELLEPDEIVKAIADWIDGAG